MKISTVLTERAGAETQALGFGPGHVDKSVSPSEIWWLSSSNIYYAHQPKVMLTARRNPDSLDLRILGVSPSFCYPQVEDRQDLALEAVANNLN